MLNVKACHRAWGWCAASLSSHLSRRSRAMQVCFVWGGHESSTKRCCDATYMSLSDGTYMARPLTAITAWCQAQHKRIHPYWRASSTSLARIMAPPPPPPPPRPPDRAPLCKQRLRKMAAEVEAAYALTQCVAAWVKQYRRWDDDTISERRPLLRLARQLFRRIERLQQHQQQQCKAQTSAESRTNPQACACAHCVAESGHHPPSEAWPNIVDTALFGRIASFLDCGHWLFIASTSKEKRAAYGRFLASQTADSPHTCDSIGLTNPAAAAQSLSAMQYALSAGGLSTTALKGLSTHSSIARGGCEAAILAAVDAGMSAPPSFLAQLFATTRIWSGASASASPRPTCPDGCCATLSATP